MEVIPVHGLLEVDVIQFMKNVKIINYMETSARVFPYSISPFENNQRFLLENQIKPVERKC